MNTRSPTECPAWAQLLAHAEGRRTVQLRDLFASRKLVAEAPGVRYDFSRQRVDAMTLRLLANLAGERGFPEWRAALLSGKPINSTEKRAAWHTALRAGDSSPPEVRETLARMRTLATRLRVEKKFRRIVNLGTGGSDLGLTILLNFFSTLSRVASVRMRANVSR